VIAEILAGAALAVSLIALWRTRPRKVRLPNVSDVYRDLVSAKDVTAASDRMEATIRRAAWAAAPQSSRIPPAYIAATWRNTTPVDPNTLRIGIGLDVGDRVERFSLSIEDARHVRETLGLFLDAHACPTRSHSASSLGSPTLDESIPRGSENV